MKTIFTYFAVLVALTLFSCGGKTAHNIEEISPDAVEQEALPMLESQGNDTIKGDVEKNELSEEILFENYCNGRYSYCIDYPKDILIPQPESENGDGRKFISETNDSELIVWGEMNVLDESIEEKFNEAVDEGGIDKKELKENSFIISGKRDDKLYFQMTKTIEDGFATFVVKYPEKRKHLCSKAIDRMIASFDK